jgi:peptide chain release factor 2
LRGKQKEREQLENKQAEPGFWDNQESAKGNIQKVKILNTLLKPFEELSKLHEDVKAMSELADEDPSFEAEIAPALDTAETKLGAFELQAMMSGKTDSANAVVRLQAGQGGTDACDWADRMRRMYVMWAKRHGFAVEEIDEVPNVEAGVQSCEFRILGEYAYGYLQSEIGAHRFVRISPFGDGGTRQTSFVGVDVTPELDEAIEVEVNENALTMQTFCSGGPGGQHQNKTQSGVRLIYNYKGQEVRGESRTERSQPKNYANALALLKARIYQIEEQKRLGDIAQRYDAKGEISFGNQIRSYVMQPYTLVRDERDGIEMKTPAVNAFLDGSPDLDEFMYAYLRYKTAKANKVAAQRK